MYLLMLLATFVSAIYGYNLSARADYERDVPRKKAAGMVYKFVFHARAVSDLLGRIDNLYNAGGLGLIGSQPNDLIYADFDTSDGEAKDNIGTSLAYKQGSTTRYFLLREKDNHNQDNPLYYPVSGIEVKNWLQTGHMLFDGSEMMTKVVCLDDEIEMMSAGASQCQSHKDGDNNIIDSCCSTTHNRFLVSYKKFDVRFINRINLQINMDFWNAINQRRYLDNIGVIQWKNNKWEFQGRLSFPPAYAEEKKIYEEEHKGDTDMATRYFPSHLRNKTYWTLPVGIFGGNYFTDKNGQEICKTSGCLFQIRYF
ncbi:MAG: hypothetical protein J6C85_03020 [Alphaproteobacteria bacterium]|nr:hypothetical protein [Alphaproteobacteria bacterium]